MRSTEATSGHSSFKTCHISPEPRDVSLEALHSNKKTRISARLRRRSLRLTGWKTYQTRSGSFKYKQQGTNHLVTYHGNQAFPFNRNTILLQIFHISRSFAALPSNIALDIQWLGTFDLRPGSELIPPAPYRQISQAEQWMSQSCRAEKRCILSMQITRDQEESYAIKEDRSVKKPRTNFTRKAPKRSPAIDLYNNTFDQPTSRPAT